jgi:predicted dehydrogenase
MKDNVRVGVIGTSGYADLIHLPLLKGHAGAVTTAICGRNRARAEEMAQKYAIPNVFTDYRDMVHQGNLDAIIVAVPDDLHYPMTMAALDAGLHVLCEKPLAFNLEQAQAMLAKAESAGVKHMTCFTYRWLPQFRYLQRLVQEDYIGKCYSASFRYMADYACNSAYQWKWDCQHGLGALGDLGSHMIDLALWTVGDIAKVQASLRVRMNRPHPEGRHYEQANETADLTVQFANGALGTFCLTAVANQGDRGQVQGITLHGEKGTLELESDWTRYTLRGIHNDETALHALPIPDDILQGIDPNTSTWDQLFRVFTEQSASTRLFVDSILADRPITPSFRDGMKAQAVIDAAFKSDLTGCWVDAVLLGA